MAMTLSGARGGRYALKQNSDINVTPFVDVMLVLLIVMMVTAPLATVSIKLDLPKSSLTSTPTVPTFISLTDDGRLYVSVGSTARPTSLETLAADVASAMGTRDVTAARVFVRADRHVSYGKFMGVMNALKKAGYEHIGLVSEAV